LGGGKIFLHCNFSTAKCNKASIKNSSADSLARNKIREVWWEAPLWWEAWGPGPLLPLNPALAHVQKVKSKLSWLHNTYNTVIDTAYTSR